MRRIFHVINISIAVLRICIVVVAMYSIFGARAYAQASEYPLDPHGYAVFSGDFDGNDGVIDYYFYSRGLPVLIHGEIAIPIISAANKTFAIPGYSMGGAPYNPPAFYHGDPVSKLLPEQELDGLTLLEYGEDYLIGDFDGDGVEDYLIRGLVNTIEVPYIVFGVDGGGVPSTISHFSGQLETLIADRNNSFIVRDVNADGRDDIVFPSGSSFIADIAYVSDGNMPSQKFEVTEPETRPVTIAGKSQGMASVSPSGSASYNLPISLPAGSGGHAPSLSLGYSSLGGNGVLGLGWALSGVSAIVYCHRTPLHDEKPKGKKDRFCIDGQRLVQLDGTGEYGDDGSVYKTEINSFRKFTFREESGGTPYFEVEGKDGALSKYSFAGNIHGGSHLFPLSERYDSTGKNLVRYQYLHDTAGFRLEKIEYAFGGNQAADASIHFDYQSRPDSIPKNAVMGAYGLKRRLSKIDVKSGGEVYRTYFINYRKRSPYSTRMDVSRVSSIQECVGGSCLEAVAFNWRVTDEDGFNSSSYATVSTSISGAFNHGRIADINGDGKMDNLWVRRSRALYELNLSLSDGEKWVPTGYRLSMGSTAKEDWNLFDYDGDGKLDLIYRTSDGWRVKLFTGQGFQAGYSSIGIPTSGGWQSILADENGDGRADLILKRSDGKALNIFHSKARADGLSQFRASPDKVLETRFNYEYFSQEIADLQATRIIDFDGNGQADLFFPVKHTEFGEESYAWALSTLTSDDLGYHSTPIDWGKNQSGFIWMPADLNRDGRTDFVWRGEGGSWFYSISVTGVPFANRKALADVKGDKANFVDYNNDGFLDIAWQESNLKVKLWTGNGFGPVIDAKVPAGTDSGVHTLFADLDGDGYQEYIRIRPSSSGPKMDFYAAKATSGVDDVITEVQGGYGKKSIFTYKPLSDSSVYAMDSGAAKLNWGMPVADVTGSAYVVATHEFSMPVAGDPGNLEKVSYRYEGLRFQGGGRGALGYRKVIQTDSRTGRLETTYEQRFPNTGMALKVERYSPQGKLLSKTSNTLASKSVDGVAWPFVDKSMVESYLAKDDGATQGARFKKVEVDSDYDNYGNLVKGTTKTWSGPGQLLSTVVQDNCFSCYGAPAWYREQGRVTRTTVTTTRGTKTTDRVVRFDYYQSGTRKGLLKSESIEPGYNEEDADRIKLTTSYSYDDYGNRTATSKVAANESARGGSAIYDSDKRYKDVVLDVDGRKRSEVVARNHLGLPTETRRYTNVTGTAYVTSTAQYDALGRQTLTDPGDGPWLRTDYRSCTGCGVAGAAYYTVSTSEDGASTTTYFDRLDRPIRVRSLGFDTSDVVEIQTEYDEFGRKWRQSEPYRKGSLPQYWTVNQYDIQSRPVETMLPDGGKVTHSEPALDGHLVVSTTTNAKGQKQTEKKNALGEVRFILDHYDGKLEYQYTAAGEVEKVISHGRPGENLGITISTSYDKRGRKESMTDPDKGTWTYSYNAFGDLLEQVDGKAQRTVTEYDRYGRPERRTDFKTSGGAENHTRWYYDDKGVAGSSIPFALGQLTAVVQSARAGDELCYAGTTNYCAMYAFDSNGRQDTLATVLGVGGADGEFIQQTEYDSLGRPYRQYDALNDVVLDGSNRMVSGIQQYFTNTGQLHFVRDLDTGNELYRVVDSNTRGQVTDFDVANGLVRVDHDHDSATGRLKTQRATNAQSVTLQQMAYGWDGIGNLESRHNLRAGRKESFCYDHLSRLLQVNSGTLSVTGCAPNADNTQYQYDSIGNITHKDGQAYAYTSAKPHAVTKAGTVGYRYDDKNGNLTSDDTGREFTYTTFDKPSVVSNAGSGNSVSFSYGPDRARYKRSDTRSTGEVITTLYIGSVELIRSSAGSTMEWKRYLPGSAVFTYVTDAAYKQQSLKRRYLLKDHIGSISAVIDGNGNRVGAEEMAFDPWGKRRDSSWKGIDLNQLLGSNYSLLDTLTSTTTRGFTGHEMVDALGIIHMNGRIYDPVLGRFLQADPMIDGVTDPQGYNRYSYVKGNPLTLTDPTGYYSWDDFKDDLSEGWESLKGRLFGDGDGAGITFGSNGIGFYAGQQGGNADLVQWAPQGGAGLTLPEGVAPGAFQASAEYIAYILKYASTPRTGNGGGHNSVVSAESAIYLDAFFARHEGSDSTYMLASNNSEDAFRLANLTSQNEGDDYYPWGKATDIVLESDVPDALAILMEAGNSWQLRMMTGRTGESAAAEGYRELGFEVYEGQLSVRVGGANGGMRFPDLAIRKPGERWQFVEVKANLSPLVKRQILRDRQIEVQGYFGVTGPAEILGFQSGATVNLARVILVPGGAK
ncbi:FG-GAP-like repeat-containing protein [Microbulbifer hydrolyticus]|uniref:RHS repeat-associated protein n=1 Tax=Microbulbifer hydrolyticus TaxID=48074 RepID=A0A6P1TA86_9GAMM|nr:FG-GAP-like repeat-containing protein [Microbulbifer hydrolyticus]MBB5212001.1 RHS repeat-associated protein [Microbulbifer hydrolyticus]QHQ39684.1 hypothetical protein GTQ55_12265 [Microbulbifer hydrolyticus]